MCAGCPWDCSRRAGGRTAGTKQRTPQPGAVPRWPRDPAGLPTGHARNGPLLERLPGRIPEHGSARGTTPGRVPVWRSLSAAHETHGFSRRMTWAGVGSRVTWTWPVLPPVPRSCKHGERACRGADVEPRERRRVGDHALAAPPGQRCVVGEDVPSGPPRRTPKRVARRPLRCARPLRPHARSARRRAAQGADGTCGGCLAARSEQPHRPSTPTGRRGRPCTNWPDRHGSRPATVWPCRSPAAGCEPRIRVPYTRCRVGGRGPASTSHNGSDRDHRVAAGGPRRRILSTW